MESILETKLLDFNLDKSVCILVGDDNFKTECLSSLKQFLVTLNKKPMKIEEKNYSYLGEIISSKGLSLSNKVTIDKRFGVANKSVYEIKSIVEDTRNFQPGGILLAFEIWEKAVIPALLYNSDCWIDISNECIKKLNSLQESFYRAILNIGVGCPKPALYFFTRGVTMKNRITLKNIKFMHHVVHLEEDSLAK